MNVFNVLSKHIDWASQRHAVAAANVANLDTPGFRAKEVSAFELEVNSTAIRIMQTQNGHLGVDGSTDRQTYEVREQQQLEETHSSNNVSVVDEMRVVGESARAISSDTALYKLFHRIAIAAAK